MQHTINDVLRTTTLNYLASLDPNNPPEPSVIEGELLENIRTEFELYNTVAPKGCKWKIPQTLEFQQIAVIVSTLYPVCRIATGGTGSLSVTEEYLALPDGPGRFRQDSSCPAVLRCCLKLLHYFGYGAFTLFRPTSQSVRL